MKHSRSTAEQEIRDAVVESARRNRPGARVVHEMNVGGCRCDLAVIGPEELIIFEIKSEKDVDTRLDHQLRNFRKRSHHTIAVLHRKFFDDTPYSNGRPRLALPDSHHRHRCEFWAYPEPEPEYPLYQWRWPRVSIRQPRAADLLDLLWKAELLHVALAYRVGASARWNRPQIIDKLAYMMTGREIAKAVCDALRNREFAEADRPIGREEKT